MMNLRAAVLGVAVLVLGAPASALAGPAVEQAEPGASSQPALSAQVAEAIAPAAQGSEQPAATTEAAPADGAKAPEATAEKKDEKKEGEQSVQLDPEAMAKQSGFNLGVDLDHSVGAGTFVNPDYYAYVGGSLLFSGRYAFSAGPVRLALTGRWGATLEYTQPDAETGRRFSHSDIRFGLSAPMVYKIPVLGVAITPSLGLTVPVTAESWNAGLVTNLSLGLGFFKGFKFVNLSGNLSGSKGFFLSSANTVKASAARDPFGNALVLCRTGETVCGYNGNNALWGLNYALSAQIMPVPWLSFGISWGMGHSWVDAGWADEFTPKVLDSNGVPVVQTGVVKRDRMQASVSLTWAESDHFSVTVYLSNSQQPKTADNQAFRFPFFDALGTAMNTTSFGLTLSAFY